VGRERRIERLEALVVGREAREDDRELAALGRDEEVLTLRVGERRVEDLLVLRVDRDHSYETRYVLVDRVQEAAAEPPRLEVRGVDRAREPHAAGGLLPGLVRPVAEGRARHEAAQRRVRR